MIYSQNMNYHSKYFVCIWKCVYATESSFFLKYMNVNEMKVVISAIQVFYILVDYFSWFWQFLIQNLKYKYSSIFPYLYFDIYVLKLCNQSCKHLELMSFWWINSFDMNVPLSVILFPLSTLSIISSFLPSFDSCYHSILLFLFLYFYAIYVYLSVFLIGNI